MRSYRDIRSLERSQVGLERVIQGSKAIFTKQLFLERFAQETLAELLKIINLDNDEHLILRSSCFRVADAYLECLTPGSSETSMELTHASPVIQKSVKEKVSVFEEKEVVMFCDNADNPLVFNVHLARS